MVETITMITIRRRRKRRRRKRREEMRVMKINWLLRGVRVGRCDLNSIF